MELPAAFAYAESWLALSFTVLSYPSGLLNALSTPSAIFATKSTIVDAVFLKKYSYTTMYGTRLSMSSIDFIASNDAGVMAIYGQVSLASAGLNEYIVQFPLT